MNTTALSVKRRRSNLRFLRPLVISTMLACKLKLKDYKEAVKLCSKVCMFILASDICGSLHVMVYVWMHA